MGVLGSIRVRTSLINPLKRNLVAGSVIQALFLGHMCRYLGTEIAIKAPLIPLREKLSAQTLTTPSFGNPSILLVYFDSNSLRSCPPMLEILFLHGRALYIF